jgi:diaminohydroxyphosphoribosylaminopyrimidine deaminase / 5-amino-6-(5-phosphoribosylamino)uracil reductase
MFDANDRRHMRKAVALAEKGLGLASPNPSVGCVIVQDGKTLGKGLHEYALLDHAEVRALKDASGGSTGATVYVTLEPCSHYGRTPPCADRLIESGVRRVVVATPDPNPKVSGQGIARLRSAGIQVDVGLMAEEARRIIEAFACRITTGLPLVVSKVGMSLDGKIATSAGNDHAISSEEGREFGQRLRFGADAILVGVGTVLADDPELTYRGAARKARPLLRVILDTHLQTPENARLFQSAGNAPVLIFCSSEAAANRGAELEKRGAELIAVPVSGEELDLTAVLHALGQRDVLSVLVEGGSLIHWSFLSRRLIDKFYFLVAPIVLGGKDAVPAVGGKGFDVIAEAPRFRICRSFAAGPDLVLETYPAYSRSIISPWLASENVPFDGRDSPRS